MENNNNNNYKKELQLLPILPCTMAVRSHHFPISRASPWPSDVIAFRSSTLQRPSLDDGGASYPCLDLQLSVVGLHASSVKPAARVMSVTDQMKMYAEHVMEMSRREMEMARLEFARARHMWERAVEEVEKAEKMKEGATAAASSSSSSSCLEITCHSCTKKFRPY